MIALRLAGCACILGAAALFCAGYRRSLDARIAATERAASFIRFTRREIGDLETPFPEIARKFAERECAELSGANALSERAPVDALGRYLAAGLCAEDAARFAEFCGAVGAGYTDDELRLCDAALAYFDGRLAGMRSESVQKKRVAAALSSFAAVTVCIMIL